MTTPSQMLNEVLDEQLSESQSELEDSSYASTSYLTPLQQSLVYELTTRRNKLARRREYLAFWQKYYDEQQKEDRTNQFHEGVIDESFYDSLIQQRKEKLSQVKQSKLLKDSIVESVDAAHSINSSMAAIPPDYHPYMGTKSSQPLRSLVARRDSLALEFLRVDSQIRDIVRNREDFTKKIQEIRSTTSTTFTEIRAIKADTQEKKRKAISSHAAGRAHSEIDRLTEALNVARGKRELVKGVLMGLILESGLEWLDDPDLKKLVLSLGDDGTSSSESDNAFESDEEEEEESDIG